MTRIAEQCLDNNGKTRPFVLKIMSKPVVHKEAEKPRRKGESAKSGKKAGVRPEVAKLIKKVVEENAPTWKALAKR